MNIKEAKEITGGLSTPSKMPGYAYNLPAKACRMGSILHKQKGSVCSGCYARKGRYMFPNVQAALTRRLKSLSDPRWVDAMVFLIEHYSKKEPFFRWHDSGDIQSAEHIQKILAVVKRTPTISHWLPTKEYATVFKELYKDEQLLDKLPNLTIRFSAYFVNGDVQRELYPAILAASVATSKDVYPDAFYCPATIGLSAVCGSCRACWSKEKWNVCYLKH